MKKLTTLLLAAGLVVSSFAGASSASAVELKPFGQFVVQLEGFSAPQTIGHENPFMAGQRFRFGFDAIIDENTSGTILFQLGETNWGNTNNTGIDTTNKGFAGKDANFGARLAYIDWTVPSTDVSFRMGLQALTLPAFAFSSSVLDGRTGGISVNVPVNENISVVALYARGKYDPEIAGDYMDVGSVIIDVEMDGFRVSPWGAYAWAGDAAGLPTSIASRGLDSAYAGVSFELSAFDPFRLAIDFNFNQQNYAAAGTPEKNKSAASFFVAAGLSYDTAFGTPALKGWYSTGNDKDTVGANIGRPMMLDAWFDATTIFFDASTMDNGMSNIGGNPNGTMGGVLQMEDISFAENLTHLLRVAYIAGTNERIGTASSTRNFKYLNEDDSVIEINLNTKYMFYKSLAMNLELGYLMPDFYQASGTSSAVSDVVNKDIFRAALSFVYSF